MGGCLRHSSPETLQRSPRFIASTYGQTVSKHGGINGAGAGGRYALKT